MKTLKSLLILVVMAPCMAVAQSGLNTGPVIYIPTTDVQGAHELGGRGCAGCHAPHSGSRGSGGATIAKNLAAAGVPQGDIGLWGTDTTAITSSGVSFNFDTIYSVSLAGLSWSSGALYTGVATCLSCHDGNISRGTMMTGQSYEQVWGLLNFVSNAGTNSAHGVNLYGTAPIPTLLGNDNGIPGDYNNDHPVGPMANLGAVGAAALTNGLTYAVNGNILSMVITPGSTYANFVAAYGTPALSAMVPDGSGLATNLYIVCTTCHNQHVQNVYASSAGVPIANGAVFSAATLFYVRGPYNPGAPYDPNHVPSTNAFCLQCHFDHSSQYFGSTTVGTAF